MIKLYKKNELVFSLLWITFYIILFSVADTISDHIGIAKAVTFPISLTLAILIITFARRNGLYEYYGLRRIQGIKYSEYLYFIPFAIIASSNLWNGVSMRYTILETVLNIASMLCVGFIEELIFRVFFLKQLQRRTSKQQL